MTPENEKYVGDLVQKKTFTPDYLTHTKKYNHGEEAKVVLKDHHEPIIDRDLWDIVQAELAKRDRKGVSRAGHARRYLFSGKIKCGECGASFVSRRKKRRDSTDYQCWCCYNAATEGKGRLDIQNMKTGCDIGKMIRNELALSILKQSISSLQMDRELLIRQMTAIVIDALQADTLENPDAAEKLEQEIEWLSQKKARAIDAFLSETITADDLILIRKRYEQELESLQIRLAKQHIPHIPPKFLTEDINKHITDIVNGNTASEMFYKNILDQMMIYKDKRIEVRLNLVPQKWIYVLEPAHFDPSVPISVSNPFSSG